MQIVIDIDDKLYKRIKYLEPRADTMLDELMRSVQSGTPLPKHHGRLIDASNLLTVTDIREDGTESTYVPYEEIEDALTIVEADAESEDEE